MATVDELDDLAAKVGKAAKDSHRAMVLTMFAVAVAIAVLAIDNSIKRSILSESAQVREIFRQFREATDGIKAAVNAAADDSPGNSPADGGASGMDEPPRAREAASGDAANGKAAGTGRKGSTRARP